jgi:hypothetical protein
MVIHEILQHLGVRYPNAGMKSSYPLIPVVEDICVRINEFDRPWPTFYPQMVIHSLCLWRSSESMCRLNLRHVDNI